MTPQSGTYVRALTEKEIADIFETRLLLESHVTRLAAARIEPERLRRLRVAFRRLAPHGRGFDESIFDDFNELDSMFHSNIYEAAGNDVMSGLLLNLLEKVRWMRSPSPPRRSA